LLGAVPFFSRYAANIEKIDCDDEKVLIHYRQWSHRYDEWFDWTSPYLRPVERIKLRRRGLKEDVSLPVSATPCFILRCASNGFLESLPKLCIRTISWLWHKVASEWW
jgi:hypothetical protein